MKASRNLNRRLILGYVFALVGILSISFFLEHGWLESLAEAAFLSFVFYALGRSQFRRALLTRGLSEANISLEKQKLLFSRVIEIQNEIAGAEQSPSNILDLVVRLSMQLTESEGSIVEIIEGDELVYHYAHGRAASSLGLRIPMEGSFSGLCLKEGRAMNCYDSEADDRVNREACRRVQLRSMVVVPLQHRGKVIGVLKNFSSKPYFFDDQKFHALTVLTGFLSASLSQAFEFNEKNAAIRELERAQKELIESRDKAHAATQAKSRFLANMSHEIRTPLNGILGMNALLLDGPLNPDQIEYSRGIKTSADALLALVNDVLDFSKIESGHLHFEDVNFNILKVLEDLHKSFGFVAREKGLQLRLEMAQDFPQWVRGDGGRLRQVLTNLVGNAIKFTQEGEVTVKGRFVGRNAKGLQLRFDVTDTGIGISKAAINGLFREFVQGDISTTRRYGGTGLGLSISQRLVERMHGEIMVESELGKGSTFWFTVTLPAGAPEQGPETRDTLEKLPPREKPWRILVAEDNQINQVIICKMLSKLGLTSDVAENGQQVLSLLQENDYDLVLMDCQMPEMDGYQATQQIRASKDQPYCNIPIVAMTANAMKEDQERALASGMNDFLAKPLEAKKVSGVLVKWLNRLQAQAYSEVG